MQPINFMYDVLIFYDTLFFLFSLGKSGVGSNQQRGYGLQMLTVVCMQKNQQLSFPLPKIDVIPLNLYEVGSKCNSLLDLQSNTKVVFETSTPYCLTEKGHIIWIFKTEFEKRFYKCYCTSLHLGSI